MAVVDTCVWLAAYNRKDDHHDAAVNALATPRILVVSPLVLDELDHLLTSRAGEHIAVEAVTRIGALARTGALQIASVDGRLLGEAEALMRTYMGHKLGLTDCVNAALAWRLNRPAILSMDHHYADVLAPRTQTEARLEVIPGPTR
ncbi:type II toxin-antitoxin system VapC family toxin [Streptomyces sp. NPDC048248]|uniref:type II toxin-antitoxin system VapC family toxin n=1 Tax=Streptomyces sp. NPDC048248 TaxID=3365523 RepID=UPI003723AA7C